LSEPSPSATPVSGRMGDARGTPAVGRVALRTLQTGRSRSDPPAELGSLGPAPAADGPPFRRQSCGRLAGGQGHSFCPMSPLARPRMNKDGSNGFDPSLWSSQQKLLQRGALQTTDSPRANDAARQRADCSFRPPSGHRTGAKCEVGEQEPMTAATVTLRCKRWPQSAVVDARLTDPARHRMQQSSITLECEERHMTFRLDVIPSSLECGKLVLRMAA
jgi:hypothetical protein